MSEKFFYSEYRIVLYVFSTEEFKRIINRVV